MQNMCRKRPMQIPHQVNCNYLSPIIVSFAQIAKREMGTDEDIKCDGGDGCGTLTDESLSGKTIQSEVFDSWPSQRP